MENLQYWIIYNVIITKRNTYKGTNMILNQYYKSENNVKVYLDDVVDNKVFYRLGEKLITATVEFFTRKYKLCI